MGLALVMAACTADDVDDVADGAGATSMPAEPETGSSAGSDEPASGSSGTPPDEQTTSGTSTGLADTASNETEGLPVDIACGAETCAAGTVCVHGEGVCGCGNGDSDSGGWSASYTPAEPACEAVPQDCEALLGPALEECLIEAMCRLGVDGDFTTVNVYEDGVVVCAGDISDASSHCDLESC